MANRNFKPNGGTLEERVVTLWGNFAVGASGAVSAVKGGGISGVVKNATAGNYTVTLSDSYNYLLSARASAVLGSIAACLPDAQIFLAPTGLQATFLSSKVITFQFVDAAGVAANPDSGALVQLRFEVRNSTVAPFD